MYVIYGYCELYLPYTSTLKEKRSIIRSIMDRLKKRINISIMEIQYQDLWQRSMLAFAAVAASQTDLNLIEEAVCSTLDLHLTEAEIISLHFDIIPILDD
ncbi:MAG: DUF503 domain-containing protein [Syntrophomonadaceae bacterium]|jgi:uncharacterized protein YlxP (DUF503 family)